MKTVTFLNPAYLYYIKTDKPRLRGIRRKHHGEKMVFRKNYCLGIALISSWLSGTVSAHDEEIVSERIHKEPFAYSYHGILVDADRREVEVTPRYIEAATDFYIQEALSRGNKEALEEYRILDKEWLRGDRINALERVKIRSTILENVIDNLLNEEGNLSKKAGLLETLQRWESKSAALRLNIPRAFKFEKLAGKELYEKVNDISPESKKYLKKFLAEKQFKFVTAFINFDFVTWIWEWLFPDATPYIGQCRDAGVPIPPDWGDSQWNFVGVLENEFIDSSSEAHAYSYTSSSPEGTCVALPRVSAGGNTIGVFGIICLGIETENACFWDKYSTPIAQLNGNIPLEDFISGVDFTGAAGNCSSCHAGENPFVIHPNANVAGGANITVDWHFPIFNPSWPTNPGPVTLSSDTSYSNVDWYNPFSWFSERNSGASCVACHKLPDAGHNVLRNEGYCDAVVGKAAQVTMPPSGSPAGWGNSNSSDYQVHIEQLWGLCN